MGLDERVVAVLGGDFGVGVVGAYLFGSEAEGRAHGESDVDVGVVLSPDLFPTEKQRFEARLRLAGELSAALGGREIDLISLNDAPPMLARHIVLTGRRIYSSDPAADGRFVRETVLRAADLEPWLEKFRRRKLELLAAR